MRRFVRRVFEPAPGRSKQLPLGPGAGIRLESDPQPPADQWFGLFESELAPHVRRFCRPGTHCVDVGSYNAYYSLVFAKLSRAPVRSYEPDPTSAARSRRNVALNPTIAWLVDIRQVAVGANTGAGQVALDDGLAHWGPPGLVKIDVEGAELEVLMGARRVLADHRPHLMVETHSRELEAACGDLLVAAGYAPVVVTPRKLIPENRPREHNRWIVAPGSAA